MEKETFGFTIETAYGKPVKEYGLKDSSGNLIESLSATAQFDKYKTYEEIPAKELPDQKEILNFVNAKNKASSRASATTKTLDDAGIKKPTLESSPEMRFNTIVKALMAGGLDEAVAKQQATTLTGYNAAA